MPSRIDDFQVIPAHTPSFSHTKSTFTHTPCTFPVEILDHVVYFLLHPDPTNFTSIANFALASYQFRQVAFRHYFKFLRPLTKASWKAICDIPGVYSWARKMETLSTVLCSHPQLLCNFDNLTAVGIDMSREGLSTQRTCIKYLFNYLPSRLLLLRISFLPRIDTSLLHRIAAHLPYLKTLQLTCTERLIPDCCWDCYEEASSRTVHSPIPEVYTDADDLSYAFGSALTPLKELQHLHLGVFLSELDILYFHLYNCCCEYIDTVLGPAALGTDLQGGPESCARCHELFAANVRATELFASASISRFLPSLQTVGWSSYFAGRDPGDQPERLTTTAWILRLNGKVKVKRAPWDCHQPQMLRLQLL